MKTKERKFKEMKYFYQSPCVYANAGVKLIFTVKYNTFGCDDAWGQLVFMVKKAYMLFRRL